ncbi:14237_t:CDS:2, partial [Gigaspora rosea]
NNCQHKYGGIGKCLPSCSNYGLHNNLRNKNDMYCCSVYVYSFSRLSYLISNHLLRIKIEEIKGKLLASFNGASEEELNNALLNSHEICSNTELNCFITHEDRRLKDNASSWTMLHYLVEEELMSKGYILYYQQPDLTKPEDSSEHYYQLTVLDEFWL